MKTTFCLHSKISEYSVTDSNTNCLCKHVSPRLCVGCVGVGGAFVCVGGVCVCGVYPWGGGVGVCVCVQIQKVHRARIRYLITTLRPLFLQMGAFMTANRLAC
jgi:hypothetical protein